MRYLGVQQLVFLLLVFFIDQISAQRRPYVDQACGQDEFVCTNGQCVKINQQCDDKPDCYDHSDEMNCLTTCSIDEFRCLEGVCISIGKRCNGYPDCRNGDDEESCECGPGGKTCDNGICISKDFFCDGNADCLDDSDEKNCNNQAHYPSGPICKFDDFECSSGYCINRLDVCNGLLDCPDGKDETNCHSTKPLKSST